MVPVGESGGIEWSVGGRDDLLVSGGLKWWSEGWASGTMEKERRSDDLQQGEWC